jgi:hypothetical protein
VTSRFIPPETHHSASGHRNHPRIRCRITRRRYSPLPSVSNAGERCVHSASTTRNQSARMPRLRQPRNARQIEGIDPHLSSLRSAAREPKCNANSSTHRPQSAKTTSPLLGRQRRKRGSATTNKASEPLTVVEQHPCSARYPVSRPEHPRSSPPLATSPSACWHAWPWVCPITATAQAAINNTAMRSRWQQLVMGPLLEPSCPSTTPIGLTSTPSTQVKTQPRGRALLSTRPSASSDVAAAMSTHTGRGASSQNPTLT